MRCFNSAAALSGACLMGCLMLLTTACASGGRTQADGTVSQQDAKFVDAAVDPDAGGADGTVQSDGQVQQDAQVSTDAAGCPGGCTTPPGDCYQATGQCVGSTCVYPYKNFGDSCNDGDNCTTSDSCDGQGNCFGDQLNCNPPHTSGGSCSGGGCVGIQCLSGWGDCDSDLLGTGCETQLNTTSDCGGCGISCTAGAHATASCSSGSCQRSCVSPYENCDNNWTNGCEIPTGVVNQCDAYGLNSSDGCWTAWCGQSSDSDAFNMSGNWYCAKCSNCEESGSQCHWCSPTEGIWFPFATCGCSNYPVVCGPY